MAGDHLNIVVAVRCYNEIRNIERFMRCYDFADSIVVSDGGSTDGSVELLKTYPKVHLYNYENYEVVSGHRWNPDAMHMNFVLDTAKQLDPDWLIFDDMDDVPNHILQQEARELLYRCSYNQVNVYRLYMWGETEYFPFMNRDFHPDYRSLWAWRPKEINIYADESIRHGTLKGVSNDFYPVDTPSCLLHYSWNPETIMQKIEHYNGLGLPMNHPLSFAGEPKPIPDWAVP